MKKTCVWLIICLGLTISSFAQDKAPDTKKEAPKPAKKQDDAGKKEAKPNTDKPLSTPGKKISLKFEERTSKALFPIEKEARQSYKLTVTRTLVGAKQDSAEPDVTNAVMDLILGTKETIDGQSYWILEWRVNGETRQKEFVRYDEGRLLCRRRAFGPQKHARVFDVEAPQIILPAQAKPGQSWEWKGTTGKVTGATNSSVLREEEITVGEKSYRCVVVSVKYSGEDGSKGTTERWYCPGVGLVKEVLHVTTQTEKFVSTVVINLPDSKGAKR